MAPPVWPVTAPACFRGRTVPEAGLQVSVTLPYALQRLSLPPYELEALWGQGLMILRVVNQLEAHAPREGDLEPAVARLEAKLDLALHLLAHSLHGQHTAGRPAPITLGAEACSLATDQALQAGDEIVLGLYLSPALALPLKLAATVMSSAHGDIRAQWIAMPEAVREVWEQWLFRQHRRMVQERRGQK